MFQRKQIALSIVLLFCISVQSSAQKIKSKLDPKLDIILEKAKRCANYSKDFIDFARSHVDDSEFEGASKLSTLAGNTYDYISGAYTILQIYDLLSCEADRSKVKPLINIQINLYVSMIESAIVEINSNLAATKMPAIATSGIKFKEDLREVKSLLESIELR